MNLLDLLFPKKCVNCKKIGNYLCNICRDKIEYLNEQICSVCYKAAISGQTHPKCQTKFGLDGVISFCNYKGPVKQAIKNLKYRFATDLLKEVVAQITVKKSLLPDKSWILLPLPLHKNKENYRGFNQAELLGSAFSEKLKLNFDKTLLIRKRATKSQVGLTQGERRENVELVFEVVKEVKDKGFYIFDDVWTSGATLKSAAKTLKKAGANSVWGLTLAHPR